MSGNLYYKTKEGGDVICLTPRDQRIMLRRAGKTTQTRQVLLAASDTPENAPVIAPSLVKINIKTGEAVEVPHESK